MVYDFLLVAAGLAILVVAGDALVKGAVNFSLRLGVPALLVGLTVVSMGTSAPELVVSIKAVLVGSPALALGNVVGSNTANILLVLGVPALIAAIPVARSLGNDWAIMMVASALFIALAFTGGFGWWQGLILLGALLALLAHWYRQAMTHRNGRTEAQVLEAAEDGMSALKIAIFLLGGIIGLPLGAQLLVTGAVDIATALGVSEAVIGLTLVAVGTSLPELATTVAAAFRREAGVALGNVIGSNIFNLLGIVGITALVGALPIPADMLRLDLWVMLAASALLGAFIFGRRPIGRGWGAALLALYAGYAIILFT